MGYGRHTQQHLVMRRIDLYVYPMVRTGIMGAYTKVLSYEQANISWAGGYV
jgi:methyl coenzyme M reductase beta subunit